MTTDASFTLVMTRLRAGDNDAADVVFRRFVHRLIALASGQLEARFRSKEDPEDVVLSVYKSFFLRDHGKPFDLADWDGLWALLATITVRKCLARSDFWHAARRDVAREAAPALDASDEALWDAVDRGPTPEQALTLLETIEELIRPLGAPERAIAELCFQGYTGVEIAESCGCSERTVGRVLARLRQGLRRPGWARGEG